MMNGLRTVPLLRVVSRSEQFTTRSWVCGNNVRLLYSGTKWTSNCLDQKNPHYCIGHKVHFHHPLNQELITNHIARLCSQKVNINQKSHSKGVASEPLKEDDASKKQAVNEVDDLEEFKNLSLYGKIKAMYRDYWYVLVPVHLVSSAIFLGTFYYAASSGVDIIAIMESLHFSDSVVNTLKDSSAGYIAIAYALYKIFTPIRYTVTLGGTTWAIKFLKTRGLIKPRPVKEAKENVQNIISAMKLPENERQKFLEDKGLPRIGKAVGQASSAMSNIKSGKEK